MKTKLHDFLRRNKIRNAKLYELDKVLGYDFIECPVSNARMSFMKSNYITGVLGIQVEIFDFLFPDCKKVCDKRVENIKAGLKVLDENGISKHANGIAKAIITLNKVDQDGKSGYDRLGSATRQTHLNNIDEFGRNGYSQLASIAIIKGNKTKVDRGLILPPELKKEFYRYKNIVTYLTLRIKPSLTTGYVTGLCGKEGAYQLDHIYSIKEGFLNKISPLVIGHINNFRMIPWEENLRKHAKSDIDINILLESSGYTLEESTMEYDRIIQLLQLDIEQNKSTTGWDIIRRLNATNI